MSINVDVVSQKILSSKKYHALYPATIKRLVNDLQSEDKARKLLHQIWGAYWPTRPNFSKLLDKFKDDQNLLSILNLQSSTSERLGFINDFYSSIFALTGMPKSIIEPACGLNPLSIFYANLPSSTTYQALDIDIEEIIFLSSLFNYLKPKFNFLFKPADLIIDPLPACEIVFLLKTLPCLEQQKADVLSLLKSIDCKYLVVSFPISSLSGKNKGMLNFYENYFLNLVDKQFKRIKKLIFPTELVFIIFK